MKTITIIFVGIVAHINQPGMSLDDTAVLPYVPLHVAQMVVARDSVLNDDRDPWVKNYCKSGTCKFPLNDFVVELQGTRGVFCNKDAVARAVPKLRDIAPTCSGLQRVVRDRDVTRDFVAYLDYGAGRLTVDSYFEDKLGFKDENGNDPPEPNHNCVACRTRYDGNLSGDKAVFVFTKDGQPDVDDNTRDPETHRIEVKGGHYVVVENNPVEPPEGESHPSHFLAYYNIMTNCSGAPDPSIVYRCVQPNYCDLEAEDVNKYAMRERRIPLADCTNSQYP